MLLTSYSLLCVMDIIGSESQKPQKITDLAARGFTIHSSVTARCDIERPVRKATETIRIDDTNKTVTLHRALPPYNYRDLDTDIDTYKIEDNNALTKIKSLKCVSASLVVLYGMCSGESDDHNNPEKLREIFGDTIPARGCSTFDPKARLLATYCSQTGVVAVHKLDQKNYNDESK